MAGDASAQPSLGQATSALASAMRAASRGEAQSSAKGCLVR